MCYLMHQISVIKEEKCGFVHCAKRDDAFDMLVLIHATLCPEKGNANLLL